MIVVRVELWSAVTGKKTEIARMGIANTGGTAQLGDYTAVTYRGRSAADLDGAMRVGSITRRGHVARYPRLRVHVWNLVALALEACAYGRPMVPAAVTSKGKPNAPAKSD